MKSMLNEQIFNTILELTKKGFAITISYVDDRDTFKVEISTDVVRTSFQFTPQFYKDAVGSSTHLIERINSVAERIILKGGVG